MVKRTLIFFAVSVVLLAQQPASPASANTAGGGSQNATQALEARLDILLKRTDDLMWTLKLDDIAEVDKSEYTSLPAARIPNPKGQGAGNPLIIRAYTFIPKKLNRNKKQPLIVFVHQGIHANFDTRDLHVIRELLLQGYTIFSPDYRGSTGYGRPFWEQIDYGGREVDDVYLGMQWMLETYPFLDEKRVGLVGWSHGGMITLMNILQHPDSFAVAYSGVPVTDLVTRLAYKGESYRTLYSAPYHIGKGVQEDIAEYRKRSPVTYVKNLKTPLLIHGNTNDEDVSVIEIEHIVDSLKAEGKKFEYKIYQDAPGGHYFNRTETKLARDSRKEIYQFLAKYLNPEAPVK